MQINIRSSHVSFRCTINHAENRDYTCLPVWQDVAGAGGIACACGNKNKCAQSCLNSLMNEANTVAYCSVRRPRRRKRNYSLTCNDIGRLWICLEMFGFQNSTSGPSMSISQRQRHWARQKRATPSDTTTNGLR